MDEKLKQSRILLTQINYIGPMRMTRLGPIDLQKQLQALEEIGIEKNSRVQQLCWSKFLHTFKDECEN